MPPSGLNLGDHVFPLWRDTGIDVPDSSAEVAEQGGDMLAAFGDAFGLKADDSGPARSPRSARSGSRPSTGDSSRTRRAHGRSRRRNRQRGCDAPPDQQRARARARVVALQRASATSASRHDVRRLFPRADARCTPSSNAREDAMSPRAAFDAVVRGSSRFQPVRVPRISRPARRHQDAITGGKV